MDFGVYIQSLTFFDITKPDNDCKTEISKTQQKHQQIWQERLKRSKISLFVKGKVEGRTTLERSNKILIAKLKML